MRYTILMASAAAILAAGAPAGAQVGAPGPDESHTRPIQQLGGPRVGVTSFTGDLATLRDHAGMTPYLMQFGWQFETRIMSTTSGHQALVEIIHLLGGLGQGEVNVTSAVLLGLRAENGLELGMGPSLGVSNRNTNEPTLSMVVAAGATMRRDNLYLPLNVAVAFAEGGPRITTLVGWIVESGPRRSP